MTNIRNMSGQETRGRRNFGVMAVTQHALGVSCCVHANSRELMKPERRHQQQQQQKHQKRSRLDNKTE